MNYTVLSYGIYLALSVRITVEVARSLHANGRVFLVESFRGQTELADSVNQLLVVGFYLINIGYMSLMLRMGDKPHSLEAMIEFLSFKIGLVLLILGGMHFFNVWAINRFRHQASM